MIVALPFVQACPVCGSKPDIGQTEPWSRENGPAPWYAGCYKMVPLEHFVGVNGDTRRQTVDAWNAEVAKIEAMSAEVKAASGKRSAD